MCSLKWQHSITLATWKSTCKKNVRHVTISHLTILWKKLLWLSVWGCSHRLFQCEGIVLNTRTYVRKRRSDPSRTHWHAYSHLYKCTCTFTSVLTSVQHSHPTVLWDRFSAQPYDSHAACENYEVTLLLEPNNKHKVYLPECRCNENHSAQRTTMKRGPHNKHIK